MAEGWIKLSRQLMDHWLWDYTPFSYGQAWIDLLMLANYEDKKKAYKGEIITCKRGDVNLSLLALAERWRWDRRTVKKFLEMLRSDGMITFSCTTHRTTITIENYEVFQDVGTTKCTAKCTTKSQQDVQQSLTTKKEKNNKEVKKIYGEYQNVRLTESEFEKLKAEFPADYQERIENLSFYMYNRKKTYTDHLATIRNWARRDGGKPAVKKNSFSDIQRADYDFDIIEKMLEGGN